MLTWQSRLRNSASEINVDWNYEEKKSVLSGCIVKTHIFCKCCNIEHFYEHFARIRKQFTETDRKWSCLSSKIINKSSLLVVIQDKYRCRKVVTVLVSYLWSFRLFFFRMMRITVSCKGFIAYFSTDHDCLTWAI